MRPAPPLPAPPGVDRCTALVAYEGPAREVVARLKYRNHRSVLSALASAMAAGIEMRPDVVTWVPTTAARRRDRGFDHAELLARAVARELHRPCHDLLARAPGPPQTGRPRAERLVGPLLVARSRARPHVLVVDDVITSGATATAAARALRRAGAVVVDVVAAARTPLPRSATNAQEGHSP